MRSKLILQVWGYTFCIWAVVGVIVAVLADNFHLLIPIAILSALVGGVGTLLAFQRTATGPRTGPASIFH